MKSRGDYGNLTCQDMTEAR